MAPSGTTAACANKIPERRGFALLEGGHHAGFAVGGRTIRSGVGQFGAQVWFSGKGDTFQFGIAPAHLARAYHQKGDRKGAYRMYQEAMQFFQSKQLLAA